MSNQQREDETIPVGFRVTKQQRDELQLWASYFANQKRIESIYPNTGKETAIIERSQIGSEALRRENPNNLNYDIREIVMKNCISIWQKATIRDALPDEYKEKQRQEAAEESHKAKYGSAQTTEFDNTENSKLSDSRKRQEDIMIIMIISGDTNSHNGP